MSNLETKAIELIDKLENLTNSVAPELVDGVLEATRMDSINTVIVGVIYIIVAILFNVSAKVMADKLEWDDPENPIALRIVFGLFSLVPGIIGFSYLISIWTWIAIFNPRLAIVHQIMEKL